MKAELKATPISNWCNFSDDCSCTFLSSLDPHFVEIQKAFTEEQTEMYGSDHIYSVDAFNEVDLPATDAATMAGPALNGPLLGV